VPEKASEPLLPITRKFLPSERSETELPITAATATFEPAAVPSVNAFVPADSCEHVRAFARGVAELKVNIAPGQLEASGITYTTGATPVPKVKAPACAAESVAAVVSSTTGACKPLMVTVPGVVSVLGSITETTPSVESIVVETDMIISSNLLYEVSDKYTLQRYLLLHTMIATNILKNLLNTSNSSRETYIGNSLAGEALPAFLGHLKSITVVSGNHTLVYQVMPDYLCLGEDTDYIHIPMTPTTAISWMHNHNFSLPTKTMVEQIYKQSEVKIKPITWNAMYDKAVQKYNRDSTHAYIEQSKRIQGLFAATNKPLGTSIAGHKKDVVLSNALLKHKNNVAIYGWYNKDGTVIQDLNASSHSVNYVDYSHGLRMVSNVCVLDGVETTLQAIWNDPELCKLIHDEPLKFQSY